MIEDSTERPAAQTRLPLSVIGVVALAFALRLLHLSSVVASPLTYQFGPDEDYYWRFARAVATGVAQDGPEFTFMDPGYGYLLGGFIKVFGANVFLVFGLQCLLDTGSAVGIWLITRKLGRPRAGIIGAALYAGTSLALMFSCSVLKEVWVASLMIWWIFIALHLRENRKLWSWFLFGVFCGVGVAFRSTFLLLALIAVLFPLIPSVQAGPLMHRASRAGFLALGLVLALAPWSLRNLHAGTAMPLPHNGGIVLHQIYNDDNPDSSIWIPPFVNYMQPSEIWRGYAAEAQRRNHRSMTPAEIDDYWKSQSLDYIESHPGRLISAAARKARTFFSAEDVPINRSLQEEAMFSPLLRLLPRPAPWLLGFGLCGLIWFSLTDRRWPILTAPVAVALITFTFFWAEDRFRFHIMAVLALCAGLGIDFLLNAVRRRQVNRVCGFSMAVLLMCATSFALGATTATRPLHWDQIVWGYIKMGKPAEAQEIATRVAAQQPDNAPLAEAIGYLAVLRHDYSAAVLAYGHAVKLRPRSDQAHFNLARALLETGDKDGALKEAHAALDLNPDPDYRALIAKMEITP